MNAPPRLYGLLAEFEEVEQLVEAARKTREAGYRRIDCFTPFPVEELPSALALRPTRLPWLVLAGGLVGGIGGYFLQYYASVISYPLNVGGRPYNSYPAFVPVTFELTILVAAFTAVLGMLALNGLPQPYHPCFNVDRFELATRDRFFLLIEAADLKFDLVQSKSFLESLNANEVFEVPM